MSSLYDDLGIRRDSTTDEIKKARDAILLRHHPDKTVRLSKQERENGVAISRAAIAAHKILSHSQRRAEYDATLPEEVHPRFRPISSDN